jgi:hypothetical protein
MPRDSKIDEVPNKVVIGVGSSFLKRSPTSVGYTMCMVIGENNTSKEILNVLLG